MKTQIDKVKFIFLVWICASLLNPIYAQISTPFNTTGFPTNYLGWDATVTDDLRIRHEGTQPIIFSTDNTERMRVFDGNTSIGTSTISPSARFSGILF